MIIFVALCLSAQLYTDHQLAQSLKGAIQWKELCHSKNCFLCIWFMRIHSAEMMTKIMETWQRLFPWWRFDRYLMWRSSKNEIENNYDDGLNKQSVNQIALLHYPSSVSFWIREGWLILRQITTPASVILSVWSKMREVTFWDCMKSW